ncbi:MAG: hypothetical protein H7Y08_07655 [Rhizobiaceae bacterium]|nr:hypothetical protein [Rhizobiaceae bacterium]
MMNVTSAEPLNEPALEPFEAVEFELALDLQDPTQTTFETCVRVAAEVVGGEILFDMPSDGTIEDCSRIAAVRLRQPSGDRILFAVLGETGATLRVATRADLGDRFHGFAKAFIGVLERIRDDLPAAMSRAAGSA